MKWFATFFAIASVFAEEDVEGPTDVVVLTTDAFPKYIQDNAVTLVEFYAPWCGHCKALKPHYDKAATTLLANKPPIKIAKVDCTTEKQLCDDQGVRGFPTLKVFRDGVASEYKGERTEESIVSTMKKQLLPAVSVLEGADLSEFTSSDRVVVVGFFNEGKEKEQFSAVANQLRDEFLFGVSSDEKAFKKYGVSAPAIVLFKKFDEGKDVYEGDFSSQSISAFIGTASVPLMDEVGPNNYELYVKRGLPIGFFFYGSESDKTTHGPVFEKLAKKYAGKISMVYLDSSKFGGHAANCALKEEWPAFAFQFGQTKWPLDQSKDFDEETITSFVDDFVAGKIEPTTKSDPIPESNDEPVKVVVGKSFADIVLDKSKDVFIEFYAPWCGHCKALAPTWDKLGATVGSDKIVIAKMDATTNDLPQEAGLEIQGFPTLALFKAGTNELVKYDGGDRSLESLVAFVKANAANGSDLADAEDHEEL
ncbi:thioredoxin-like protein [Gorgonomyces haynaldii]|nr:thioredoxin-like protein [Gorgonomyces haynaldii]